MLLITLKTASFYSSISVNHVSPDSEAAKWSSASINLMICSSASMKKKPIEVFTYTFH